MKLAGSISRVLSGISTHFTFRHWLTLSQTFDIRTNQVSSGRCFAVDGIGGLFCEYNTISYCIKIKWFMAHCKLNDLNILAKTWRDAYISVEDYTQLRTLN